MAWLCLNCGTENEDDEHTFCSSCGAEQGTTHAQPASTVAMEPDEVEGDQPLGDPGDEAIAAMPDEPMPDEPAAREPLSGDGDSPPGTTAPA